VKTTLLKLLCSKDPNECLPTLAFNVKPVVRNSFKLNVWDIDGQNDMRQYWQMCFDNVDGMVNCIIKLDLCS
jgi:GTPase SAR1 family protein